VSVRRWLGQALGRTGEVDPDAFVDAAYVPLTDGPRMLAELEAAGLVASGFETYEVATAQRTMRIQVRQGDLAEARAILQEYTDVSTAATGGGPDGDGSDASGPDDELDEAFGGLGGEDDEGDADILGELFVAADRLLHAPDDADVVAELAAVRASMPASPPFGVDPALWQDLATRCDALEAASGLADDEAIVEQAREIRTLLRDLV